MLTNSDGNATDEIDVAAQFLGFWKNFIDTFDMQGRKVSLTGESYAGNFVSKYGLQTFLSSQLTVGRFHTSERPC